MHKDTRERREKGDRRNARARGKKRGVGACLPHVGELLPHVGQVGTIESEPLSL